MTTLTLYELYSLVRQTIERTLDREYWVEAELSECRESRGHCYMELIQYESPHQTSLRGGGVGGGAATPIARAQAKCWRAQWFMLQPMFERVTGQRLHAGMKVRLKVYPQFHEAYGFSWIVTDIDPTFTLGDMARRRQEIIARLKAEGVFDMQKMLSLPLFCLNIAVISSTTAAGYGDFVNQLADSPFAFRTQLFTATMQGEQVEQSIIAALNSIFEKLEMKNEKYDYIASEEAANNSNHISHLSPLISHFDCVVIIRGGGATADLSGFDTLALAENVAQFPLPIITGIGHDRDESILDMVSHTRVKTPTAAAQFLISHAEQTLDRIGSCEERLLRLTQNRLEVERLRLARLSERIPPLFSLFRTRQETRLDRQMQALTAMIQSRIDRERMRIATLTSRLSPLAARLLEAHRHRLQLLEQRSQALDPALLLRRGYSITLLNGHALRDAADALPGDVIETRLDKGLLHAKVTDTTK